MEFRRINGLPPYVFAHIDALKLGARRAGRDVIDLGFGNPDIASPDVAVEKLAEAVQEPAGTTATRRVAESRSSARRSPRCIMRRFGVEIDPDTEAVVTIGAKEGLSHLMWVLLGPGDSALVPSPSYPIHIYAPLFAGAEVRQVRLEDPGSPRGRDRRRVLRQPGGVVGIGMAQAAGRRPVVPAQPDDLVCRPAVDDSASSSSRSSTTSCSSTTSPTRTSPSTDTSPPSILEVPGREGLRRRALHPHQVVLDGGLAGRVPCRQLRDRPGSHQDEELPGLRHVPADPDRGNRRDERGAGLPEGRERHLPGAPRRAVRRSQPDRVERHEAERDDVRLGSDPRAVQGDGIARFLGVPVESAEVATSPGVGFGPGGDGHVRFALIENEQRIGQADEEPAAGAYEAVVDPGFGDPGLGHPAARP